MADDLHVDLAGIEETTRRMRSYATDLDAGFKSLKDVLTAHDGCWGSDDIGKGFGEKYTEKHDSLMEAGDHIVSGYVDLPQDLMDVAKQFMGLDRDAAGKLDHEKADVLNNPPPPPPSSDQNPPADG